MIHLISSYGMTTTLISRSIPRKRSDQIQYAYKHVIEARFCYVSAQKSIASLPVRNNLQLLCVRQAFL